MIRALLGGSFDPFHNGHLALVHHLLDGAWADRVVVVPAHRSPHKAHPVASGADRLAMARLALAGIAGASVDSREVERGGISYTVDTLAELSVANPGDQWRLVIGADNLSAFTTWRRWRRLLELAELLVGRCSHISSPAVYTVPTRGAVDRDHPGRKGCPCP